MRGEAPVPVLRVVQPVLDVRAHGERVVDSPAAGSPARLRDEQVGHQRLEHVATPRRHQPHPAVGVGALEHVDAEVGPVHADGLLLHPGPVARVRESSIGGEVLLRRDLAAGDPDVRRDPCLGVAGVVVELAVVDVRAGTGVVALVGLLVRWRGLEEATAHQSRADPGPGVGVVVVGEVHLVQQRIGQVARPRLGVADHHQRGGEPPVVDARHERCDRPGPVRVDLADLTSGLVVPVEVHAARVVVVHPGHRGERLGDPAQRLLRRDDAEPHGRPPCSRGSRRCWSARCSCCAPGW